MQDVARRAGVHAATVSRALRNRAGVSAEVKAKVLRVAAELGYRPNPLVSALIRSRHSPYRAKYHATLAYLTPLTPKGAEAYRADYRDLFEGASKRAADYGYRFEEFSLGAASMSAKRFSDILLARNIPGLFLAPLNVAQDTLAVDWTRFPVVAIGFSQRIPVTRVVHNHSLAVREAIARCRLHGRRRIGLVLPRRVNQKVESHWLAAYLLDQFEQSDETPVLPPLLLDEIRDREAFAAWMAAHRPDAIIGLQHFTPMHRWLKASGRQPQDVALVTLDFRENGIKFAGIYQDYALLGAVAVDQLVGLVERDDRITTKRAASIVIDGVWRDGPTLV